MNTETSEYQLDDYDVQLPPPLQIEEILPAGTPEPVTIGLDPSIGFKAVGYAASYVPGLFGAGSLAGWGVYYAVDLGGRVVGEMLERMGADEAAAYFHDNKGFAGIEFDGDDVDIDLGPLFSWVDPDMQEMAVLSVMGSIDDTLSTVTSVIDVIDNPEQLLPHIDVAVDAATTIMPQLTQLSSVQAYTNYSQQRDYRTDWEKYVVVQTPTSDMVDPATGLAYDNVFIGNSPRGTLDSSLQGRPSSTFNTDNVYTGFSNVTGGKGNDLIVQGSIDLTYSAGRAGDDIIQGVERGNHYGGDDDDVIMGSGSDNFAPGYGDAGDDYITGVRSAFGGSGDDVIRDVRTADGGNDDDIIFEVTGMAKGGAGDDVIYDAGKAEGGDDNDVIFNIAGTASGGEGNDLISNAAVAKGDAGEDIITDSEEAHGGDDDDILAGNVLAFGGDGADFILGTHGDDALHGDDGNDTFEVLLHAGDHDQIDGGADDDVVRIRFDATLPNLSMAQVGNVYTASAANSSLELKDVEAVLWDQAELDAGGTAINAAAFSGEQTVQAFAGGITFQSGDGNDTLLGGANASVLKGGGGNDYIRGGGNGDTLFGEAGTDLFVWSGPNDVYDGGEGVDTIVVEDADGADVYLYSDSITGVENVLGGLGLDRLVGDGGDNVIAGNEGNDFLNGLGGNDELHGDAGDDVIYGDDGMDVIKGGEGDDTVLGGDQADAIYGGEEDDALQGEEGNDHIEGGQGDDVIGGGRGHDVLRGGEGADVLHGNEGNDTFYFGDRLDVFHGGVGHDVIQIETVNVRGREYSPRVDLRESTGIEEVVGTEFTDHISGTLEDDLVRGEDGRDYLLGLDGRDRLYGGEGDDVLVGGNDNDKLFGGAGTDLLFGEDGNDYLNGSSGIDHLYGGTGNDIMDGGQGDDMLRGGSDHDWLRGGTGNDVLFGDEGHDMLFAGAGNDNLYGGAGNDTFVFGMNLGVNRIWDYEEGDTINMGNVPGYSVVNNGPHTLVVAPGTAVMLLNYDGDVAFA